MTEHWEGRLSEYADGDLDAAETAACESHLADCAACRAALAALRDLIAHARRLPDAPPATDLWPGIAARLDASPLAEVSPQRAPGSRRVSLGLGQALAAAAALVVVSLAAAWWWSARPPLAPAGRALARGDAAHDARPGAATLVAEDARYEATVAELHATFERRRADLDTSTVRVVEMNLAIIDRAMDDARRALANDPADPYLNDHLRRQMRRKVDLLRLATTAGLESRGVQGS